MTKQEYQEMKQRELFQRLERSKFRSRFHLTEKDKAYIKEKGWATIKMHAQDFIAKRLAPANLPNDGKQTPMRGHPVFIAQHATATCCRGCLFKWHKIAKGKNLSEAEQDDVVEIILAWLKKKMMEENSS